MARSRIDSETIERLQLLTLEELVPLPHALRLHMVLLLPLRKPLARQDQVPMLIES